eukprot:TRINITY_DN1151_c0_g1_i1.p1 TRINITY_DN1151_c0_g1~~TRINITY_DN1151_c0_g1_i1.p1  ORF type:complete len:735 (+),score=207.31 TRINITY_DN1151_c0_g1_i1:68-2272(+)
MCIRDSINTIHLPQIVVVGAQSTGKSSVLESIIGHDCLPRGSGIVTRRPIVIQLHNTAKGSTEYAEFFHKKGERIENFDHVIKEIERETEKVAGTNKGINPNPVYLKIFSPHVVDLTLVDLPGITKIPVGDQPSDIETKIRDMIMTYIRNPNSIILALTSANTDLANSDSLKLAREVDPEGKRTIGVVTKIDLMDEGTDALDTLQGKVYPLKLGYVGVVCRSQKELNSLKSVQDALVDEKAFFDNHRVYKKYSDKLGVPYLIKLLNFTLINHIKASLPSIRENLSNQIQQKEYEMSQYGDCLMDNVEDKNAKGYLILNLINKFCAAYSDLIKGKYLKGNMNELCGGARINYIFDEIFRKTIIEIDPFDVLTDEDIRTAIKNAKGLRPSLFIPEEAFDILIRQQISRLQEPSLECSHLVHEELRRILMQINIPEITRYDILAQNLLQVMEDVLNRCLVPTDEMIRNLIEIELGYINISHPDFIGGGIELFSMGSNNIREPEEHKNDTDSSQKVGPREPVNRGGPKSNASTANTTAHKPPLEIIPQKLDESRNSGFFGWFGLGSQKKQAAEELDSKLNLMNEAKKDGKLVSRFDSKEISFGGGDKPYPNYFVPRNQNNQYQRTPLPPTPNVIKVSDKPSTRDLVEMENIKNLMISYFNVVKKNINDSVPKTIMTKLVNQTMDICHRELVSALYKEDKFEEFLAENNFISKCREECKQTLILLKNCMNILTEFEARY